MSQESQKSHVVLILVAIIGIIGTITASAIVAFSNREIEKERQSFELTKISLVSIATQGGATQISMAGTISAPTSVPINIPLDTPIIPTVGNTNPVGIVQSDMPIYVDGFALSFRGIFSVHGAQDTSNIGIQFSIKNIGDRNRVFRYTGSSLTLRDDVGNTYPIYMLNGQNASFECTPRWQDIQQINIDMGSDITLKSAATISGCWDYEHSSLPQFTGQMSLQAKSFFIGFKDFGSFTGFEIEVKP
jgi:hypothetical protein